MADSVISRFDIQLDAGSEPVFKGGEVITGRLLIELRQPLVINAVRLQMKGRAVWLNDPMKKDDIEKVLFDNDFTLLERPPGKPEPGHFTWIGNFTYSLPFECPLPKGCPTSYEGPYAFVRYFIRASLVHEEENGKTHEYYVKNAFSIVSPSDGYLVIGESQKVEDTATFGKCCCKGKISAELELPKTGYLPGEAIYGTLRIGPKYPKDILQHMEVRLVDRVRRVGAPDVTASSPWRTLYYQNLSEEGSSGKPGKGVIQRENLFLLTVPAVCPTTKGAFESVTNEIHSMSPYQNSKLLESPSTATLRFRKQPFLRIEYALQLSLGHFLLLEVPIDIGEHSTRDSSVALKPFIVGAQPIDERDESGKIAVHGPYLYTPVYPYKDHVTSELVDNQGYTPTVPTIIEEPIANGSHSIVETQETHHDVATSPDGEKTIVTTTKTTVTHVDGNETKTMEEIVVQHEGGITRTIEETVLTEDGIEKHRVEETTVDEDGNEELTADETERKLSAEELKEKKEEILNNSNQDLSHMEQVSQELTDGEETRVYTEEHEEDGKKTIKTTTVIHHADGGESTLVQEETTTVEEDDE